MRSQSKWPSVCARFSAPTWASALRGLQVPTATESTRSATVFVSLATKDGTYVRELHVGDRRTRSYVRRVSGNYIFDMMRRYLQGLEVIKEN